MKGNNNFESGVPESFNVLVKEIRALGLMSDKLVMEKNLLKGFDNQNLSQNNFDSIKITLASPEKIKSGLW